MAPPVRTLLERDTQLERIDELIAGARSGTGSVVSIEGAAGIGKTELLRVARERSATAGLTVLSARCGELERDMAFGVARQLLEQVVVRGSDHERAALLDGTADLARGALGLATGHAAPSDQFAALRGLYWVCSNLCERGPVMLAVDDAHWGDLQSLRWLAYLARRVEDLPIFVLLATRADEAGAAREAVRTMLAEGTAEPLALAPLGVDAVRGLVCDRFVHADPAFGAACHHASGGNPLLLQELLVAMGERGVSGTAGDAVSVDGIASTSLSRYVNTRLGRLGDTAVAVARAAAVLGASGAQLGQSARLAGAALEDAARSADDLRAADILREDASLEFVHPLVRAAVYADIALSARSEAHAAAAKIVAADGGGLDRVAAHLLAADPRGDPWAVKQLRAAAQNALEGGAPDAAAALLARALAEPPAAEERIDVLLACGKATFPVDPGAAAERFDEALALATEPAQRAQIVRPLAKALGFTDRPGEAVAKLASALDELDGVDEELVRLVECEWLMWADVWLANPDREAQSRRLRTMAGGLSGETVSERMALGQLAWLLVVGETPVGETLSVVRRALRPGRVFTDPEQGFEMPTLVAATYMYCDELEHALQLYDRGIDELREAGWTAHLIMSYSQRAHVRLRQGALLEAEADTDTAWGLASELGPTSAAWWFAFGNVIQVKIARGSVEQAQEVVEAAGVGDLAMDGIIFPLPRVVRGQLHAARGDHESAVRELLAVGAAMDARGYRNPSWTPWRISVTPSLAALGRTDEARSVIGEAVVRARRVGTPLALGAALRAAGQLETGDTALTLLAESVRVLERSPGRLEHATSLVAYGSALRRAKRWGDARPPLREGLELAEHCGARGLAARAREEIAAAGGRTTRERESGVAALTASELRVARRAGDGLTNKGIAQDLFITVKTVEKHLAGAYRKLDCSRHELAGALGKV